MPPTYPSPTRIYHKTSYPSISPLLPRLTTRAKNIVITGGGSGIGSAIARSFAVSGARTITILGRRKEPLSQTKIDIERVHSDTTVFTHVTDLVDRDSVTRSFAAIKASIGVIDILVANAGFLPPLTTLADTNPDDFSTAFEINVNGNMNLLQAFLPLASPTASVLHVTAGAVHVSPKFLPGFSAYGASKLAAAKVFDYLRSERPEFFVLNFHPGIVRTGMTGNPGGTEYDDVELAANFAVWAVSPEARFLNGRLIWANWDVDELKGMAEEIETTNRFTFGLIGWP